MPHSTAARDTWSSWDKVKADTGPQPGKHDCYTIHCTSLVPPPSLHPPLAPYHHSPFFLLHFSLFSSLPSPLPHSRHLLTVTSLCLHTSPSLPFPSPPPLLSLLHPPKSTVTSPWWMLRAELPCTGLQITQMTQPSRPSLEPTFRSSTESEHTCACMFDMML